VRTKSLIAKPDSNCDTGNNAESVKMEGEWAHLKGRMRR